MFHVVLIHACNMRRMHWHHALHMHGRIASGRVWVQGIFTGIGEWVVNSGKNGTNSKVEIHECVNDQNDKLHVLGGASWGRPPPPPQG